MRIQLIEPSAMTAHAAGGPPGQVTTSPPIPVGVQVELRSRFDDRWTHGFAIAAAGEGEYQLRRLSDGHVLPAWFPAGMLRPLHEG